MKKNLTVLVALVMSLSLVLAACGGGSKTSEDSKVLRLNLGSEPPTLHPGLANDNIAHTVLTQTFEGLTRIGADGKPHNAVAEKIEKSDDATKYTITLRKDAKWSNGDPVTAKDFEYAWEWVLTPENEAKYAYQLYYIKNGEKYYNGEVGKEEVGVKVTDDYTLEVELEQPTPFFEELLAFYTYYPVNSKIAEKNPKWASDAGENYTSNGPFILDTWKHNDQLILKKNENYFDKDKVKLDEINFTMIGDANTELNKFNSGEIDWAGAPIGNSIPTEAIKSLDKEGKLNIQPIAGVYWLKFNTEVKPFNNKKVRQALGYAINRQDIIDNVLQGGQQAAMANVPPTMIKDSEKGYFKDGDVKQAKQLLEEGLKEEGFTGVDDPNLPTFELAFNSEGDHKKLMQAVQDVWSKELGIKTELKNEEWKVYIEKLHSGNYQIGRMGWIGDFNDPINFLELFKDKDGGNNDTKWENEEFKSLLTQSQTELDAEKRLALLKQADQIITDEMPIVPLYFYTNVYVKNDKLDGYYITGLGAIDLKEAHFKK